ncbi:relaxase, partial [Salmonella enterica subsp. enterica]|nr:relaxase [Salmonella enterica subsp. enterica]
TILRTTERRESIGRKIAELELRLREDKRNEIVEKILQKNAVQQQNHLLFLRWLASLKQLIELLRSYGKSILHKTHTHFSKIHVIQPLNKARKIRL